MVSSPEISGGAGFSFEDASVAIYLAALLGEESGPGLSGRLVTRVAVQQAAFGEPLDDLIVDAKASDGTICRLSLQVKRTLTLSAAPSNTDFREIVVRAWQTRKKTDFREDCDCVGAVTGTVAESVRRAFEEVCEWARVSTNLDSFLERFEASGFAGDERKNVLEVFRTILSDAPGVSDPDATAYRLLRHFVVIKFSVLTEGSTDDAHAIERLRYRLSPRDQGRAADVWARLLATARSAAGRAGEFDRAAIIRALGGNFRFAIAPSLQLSLQRIDAEAGFALRDIRSEVDGVAIPRPTVQHEVQTALASHRFVQIVGLPGTGKSAALKEFAVPQRQFGTILMLKSDRLTGSNWHSYAQSLSLEPDPLDALLIEIGVTGTPILFIDGLDRLSVPHRPIVTDLIGTILDSPSMGDWKILATLRDNGIEPLRTWLPPQLFDDNGVGTVEVKPFDDDEAALLAQQKPVLKGLLFGEQRVQEIARRAFFADVLARALPQTIGTNPPGSETELIEAWWLRGGYNSDGSRASIRQRALIKLAASSARTPHRRINVEGIDAEALHELKSDGIIRDARLGHSVGFTHDIFFEWSFLHVLFEHEDDWINQITAAGEPPVLARSVELMSQATISNFDQWLAHLATLETANVRSQWARTWLTAAFGSAQFRSQEQRFTQAMLDDDAKHLRRLTVWFQAEKTKPNPLILDRSGTESSLSRRDIIRQADMFAWPSDLRSWQRFLSWITRNVARIPVTALPDVLSAFQVWQNMWADYPNKTSQNIAILVGRWLEDIEDHEHSEELSRDRGQWAALDGDERDELEERLRDIFLRTVRVERDRAGKYLTRMTQRRRLRDDAFNQVIGWATLLSEHHAKELVALTMAALTRELPEQIVARKDEWQIMSRNFSPLDHHEMSISEHKGNYFPASPLREPFASLFEKAPDQALSLVRGLTNHAVTAWRQLNTLSYHNNHLTPIPLELHFPWARQTFWGDQRIYLWSRGQWGPPAVMSGLMSLEKWAFDEAARGRTIDDVIQTIIEGHEACAVLEVVVALILDSNHVSPATLPIATSQRVWHWDVARRTIEGGAHSNLIGFWRPVDRSHAEAVRDSNLRSCRNTTLRWIPMLFVLHHDSRLAAEAQQAIQAFPDNLSFEYEEEKQDTKHVEALRRTAQIWSDAGNLNYYKAEESADGKHITISLDSPKASDPDVVAVAQRSQEMNDQLTVLNWVHDSFENKRVSDKLTVADALNRASKRQRFRLLSRQRGRDFTLDQDQALVAGAAAIAVLYGGELTRADLNRSAKILFQASTTPEHRGPIWVPIHLRERRSF
jgi:hypothetical protein